VAVLGHALHVPPQAGKDCTVGLCRSIDRLASAVDDVSRMAPTSEASSNVVRALARPCTSRALGTAVAGRRGFSPP